jgi:hypothetical protein
MQAMATQAVGAIDREHAQLVNKMANVPANLEEAIAAQQQHKLFQTNVEVSRICNEERNKFDYGGSRRLNK